MSEQVTPKPFSEPDGTLWTPSNRTDFMAFQEAICGCCANYVEKPETGGWDCKHGLLTDMFCDLREVTEWTWQGGQPTCSKCIPLGIDGEPLPEPDPRQMTMEVE